MCVRDESPRSCCCGCSLTCGVATFTVLAGIGALLNALQTVWFSCAMNAVACGLGLWAIYGKSVTSRMVYFYYWVACCIGAVVFWIVIAIMGASVLQDLCLQAGGSAEDCGQINGGMFIPIILICLAFQAPILYLGTHIAYAYVAEGKEELDEGYKTAP